MTHGTQTCDIGRWPSLASAAGLGKTRRPSLIGLGIVMLMQPFSLELYSYSFVTILAGTLGFVSSATSRSRAAMAEIRVENLQKRFGDFTAVQGSTFTVDDGDVLRACSARPAAARPRRCA